MKKHIVKLLDHLRHACLLNNHITCSQCNHRSEILLKYFLQHSLRTQVCVSACLGITYSSLSFLKMKMELVTPNGTLSLYFLLTLVSVGLRDPGHVFTEAKTAMKLMCIFIELSLLTLRWCQKCCFRQSWIQPCPQAPSGPLWHWW